MSWGNSAAEVKEQKDAEVEEQRYAELYWINELEYIVSLWHYKSIFTRESYGEP